MAQNSVFPAPHWGGVIYPSLRPTKRIGIHFVGFTQYGKELDQSDNYVFEPYNDIDKTLGFNLIAASNTRYVKQGFFRSNLTYRSMIFAGITDDHVPRFLQNIIAHKVVPRIKRQDDALPVPRNTTDTHTPERISLGPTRADLFGYSGELDLRLFSRSNSKAGGLQFIPTGFFVGGGFSFSTLQHELYVQFGAHPFKRYDLPGLFRIILDWRMLSLSAMSRLGVLQPGWIFGNIASRYVIVQGTVSGVFRLWLDYPIKIDFSIASTTGMFVQARDPAEIQKIITIDERKPEDVYQTKEPLKERYYSLKVLIGSFIFETYNDSYGGKDKGPSFGARFSLVVSPDNKRLWGLLDWL